MGTKSGNEIEIDANEDATSFRSFVQYEAFKGYVAVFFRFEVESTAIFSTPISYEISLQI